MSDIFIPADPKNIPIRPLNKGMIRDLSVNTLPTGAFWTISNYFPESHGLKKRPGLAYYATGTQISSNDQPIIGVVPLWKTTGSQAACLLTSRYLYTISGYVAPSGQYWTYTTGRISVSSTAVVGYGTEWNTSSNSLFAGDWLTSGSDEIEITSIDSDYGITLSSAGTTVSATDYIEYGNCENANSPTLDGGTQGLTNATWARSAVQNKYGTYSWVLTDDGSADGYVWLDDVGESATNDMHGLSTATTYYLYAWAYTDVATVGNADVIVREYYSGAWHDTLTLNVTTASAWESLSGSFTTNASATGISIKLHVQEASKVLYIDRLCLVSGGGTYAIRRKFHVEEAYLIDSTVCDNKVLFADHFRPPYGFDGTTFAAFYSGISYIPGCLTFFADRLWMANTIESNTYYRQRIRWSSVTDHTSFSASNYIDLPYLAGEIRRILPLGTLLAVYFRDGIYFGRPTNIPSLPYSFYKVDTGGIGLVGSKALTSALNGHFFVGQDDIYFVSQQGIKKLNCPVAESMIKDCENFDHIYLCQDPNNDRIVLGFPESGTFAEKVWMYNYKSQAWSYENVNCTSLSNPMLDLGLTWDDLTVVLSDPSWNTGMADFTSWDSITAESKLNALFYSNNGYVYYLSADSGEDESGAITAIIETGDMDFGFPDKDKTVHRLSLKINERPSATLNFITWGSDDGGESWKSLGTLTIGTDVREGKVDFRLTGSALRFKLTESSTANSYIIIEIILRVEERDIEVKFD